MSNKKQAKQAAIWSIVVNIFLALSKLLVGIMTSSVVLVADAIHSSLDMASSVVSYLGIRASDKPADDNHQYGYEKYESLTSLVIVGLVFLSAGWIMFEAITKLLSGDVNPEFTFWGIIVVIISIVVNEVMARAKFHFGKSNLSLALVADAQHSRADAISSVAVLISLLLIKVYPLADVWTAIIVGLYIFYSAYELGKGAVDVLVDKANPEIERQIRALIKKKSLEVSEIKTRKIGATNFAEVFLICKANRKIDEVSKIISDLENELLEKIVGLEQVSINVKSYKLGTVGVKGSWGRRHHLWKSDGEGYGPGGDCVCPQCGYHTPHVRGISCQTIKCPHCNVPLVRK